MSEERFSVAAYALIRDASGQVLLTRRRESGDWVLPGGSVEQREAPWEAVVREVAEETGLDVAVERLVGVYAKRRESDVVFVFTGSPLGGVLRSSDERDRVEFVDPEQLPDDTNGRDRERIADALAEHTHAVLAVQPSEDDEPPAGTR